METKSIALGGTGVDLFSFIFSQLFSLSSEENREKQAFWTTEHRKTIPS